MGGGYTPRETTQAIRSESSVDLFITKLEHRLPEIRERAADSLLSAVSLGLLPAHQLAARLRSQLLLPGWAGRQQALQLLDQLTTNIPGDGQRLATDQELSPGRSNGGEHSPVRRVGGERSPGRADTVGRHPSPVRASPRQTSPPHGVHPGQIGGGSDPGCSGDFIPVVYIPDGDDTALEDRMLRSADSSDGEREEQEAPDTERELPPPPDEPGIIHSLPWKALVESDLHVLTSTATSLTSGDGRAVRQALQFLNDVTLRDFPAEVFLQRPVLLQAVFHVLVSTDESETDLILSCLECLTSLTETLLQRCEVLSAPDTRQTTTLTAGPSPEESAAALSLPTFCGQLLSQALSCLYVRHWAVLVAAGRLGSACCRLARRTVPARLWTRPKGETEQRDQQALMKALKVFDEVLRWHHTCCQSGDSVLLHRAGWLLAAGLLADAWSALRPPPGPWARRHRLLAAPLHALLDELLFAQQPALHGRLLRLVTDAGCARLWCRLERLRAAMEAARRLADGGSRADALAAAAAIELHGGREMVERAVAAVCETESAVVTPTGTGERQEETKKGEEDEETENPDEEAGCRLLQRLLSSRQPAVRTTAYRRAAAAARAALRDTGRRTVPVLLQPAVLELALTDGLTDRETEADATDLVLYAVTSEAWVPQLRPVLITALPLFLCHVTRPQLTRPLNHVIGLCRAEHLRSDVILTTHRSRAVRHDAWSRIVSRLSAQNATAELLPDLSQLGDLDLAELTLVDDPPPVTSRRGEVNDVLTLTALLPLAWCASAALDVRRATLSQLAVLLQDPDLHRAFLDHDGLPRLLSSVTRAVLREPDLTHDVSLLPDCVSVLRHLALFSAGCRHHLGDDPQLLLLLVRVLLMFRLDDRVRVAVAQLLLAASLDTALICRRRPGAHTWDVLLPEVMSSALRLPFIVTPRCRRQLGRAPDELPISALTEPVTVAGERVSVSGLLRSAWSLAWHGELREPPAAVGYSRQLVMAEWQLAAAAAGRLERTAAETLRQLEGVSSHTAARVLLSQLGCYVTLHCQLGDSDSEGVFSTSAVDRWLSVLRRHLLTPPSSEPDRRVLTVTLQLLLMLPPDSLLPDRALSLLSEHSLVFTDTLAQAAGHHQPSQQQTALRALQLLAELCCRPVPGAASLLDTLTSQAMAAAALAGSEHFYSLVSVQRCAALLQTALLSPHPLPESLLPAVRLLRDFSAAFLPAAGPTDSCMGAGVLAAAAVCLPAVTDRQSEWTEEWAAAWSAELPDGGRLLWLAALWHHHQTQVRWGGLAAALGLSRWPEGAALLTQQLRHLPGGCWGAALGLLLDAGEAAAVREQAALLLASLTAHLLSDETGQLCGPEVANTDSELCLTGPAALVALLEHSDWPGQLARLMTQLQGGAASDPGQMVTPGLVAAALRFTHNAAVLSPADVVGGLTDAVYTLVQCSYALGVLGGWREWPPADVAPCWTEAVRLCSALVLLEQPGRPGAAHLLLCDRRLLTAAAGTAVTTADSELCEGLFSLLLALLSVDRDAAFSASAELLLSWPELWPALASVPALLQPLLATEAARLLRLRPGPPQLDGLESAGEPLCAALLARGAAGRRPLAALLLVSPAAKRAALAGQLHRRLTGQLRENIAALVTGSLSVRAARSKAKERSLLSDLVADLDLLRNLMSGSAEVKQALASDGLPNLLHKLWPWCVTSRRLTVTVLCTLNTLAAGCVDGARGLAYTSAALHQAPSGSPSGASLVHVVLDDCQRHLERRSADGGAVQRLAVSFSLLAAAALVQEGRAIICRSPFLSGFRFWRGDSGSAAVSEQKRRLAVTRLWMLLIKNVTFFDEGQKVVARIPEVTGSLVALMSQEDANLRSSAVLVLRNLSYLTPMQTALINTDGFVDGVAAALGSGPPAASCAAAALCLRLLTNSRKARAVLTSTAHLEKLKSAAHSLDVVADEQTTEVLNHVRELLDQEGSALAAQLAPTG